MITPIEFFVHGIPKAQPRPRAFAKQISAGKWQARVYDSGTAEGWKSSIAIEARPHVPPVPFSGPIALRVVFFMPRPQRHYKPNGTIRDTAPHFHTSKADADNLGKAVKDCLTALGFWRDDSQICDERFVKQYCYTAPGASITIREPVAETGGDSQLMKANQECKVDVLSLQPDAGVASA